MRTVNIDKLNFVGKRLSDARNTVNNLSQHCKELSIQLRQTEKSFNLSKGALKSWQDAFSSSYDKRLMALQEENSNLKEENEQLKQQK